jgi:fumarate hydratase class II
MAAAWVVGADAAVAVGGLSGNLELNVMQPLIIYNLLWSMTLIANASRLLADKCVNGIKANKETAEAYVEISLSMATALAPRIGYDKAAEIAKESVRTGKTVREICRENQVLPEDELSRLLDARGMTGSG